VITTSPNIPALFEACARRDCQRNECYDRMAPPDSNGFGRLWFEGHNC
jgi:hypothetical protein